MAEKTYHVALSGYASARVTADLDGLSKHEREEKLYELAYEEIPSLCHQCTGGSWGHSKGYLEVGDEWEITEVLDEHGKELGDDGE